MLTKISYRCCLLTIVYKDQLQSQNDDDIDELYVGDAVADVVTVLRLSVLGRLGETHLRVLLHRKQMQQPLEPEQAHRQLRPSVIGRTRDDVTDDVIRRSRLAVGRHASALVSIRRVRLGNQIAGYTSAYEEHKKQCDFSVNLLFSKKYY